MSPNRTVGVETVPRAARLGPEWPRERSEQERAAERSEQERGLEQSRPVAESQHDALEAVWEPARAAGSLGSVSIEELRGHAEGYISPSTRLERGARCVDLGTGVGVPGVLLAIEHSETTWRLLDSSSRRCEIALDAVRAAGLDSRVEVVHGRADDYGHDPHWRSTNDLVVARLFGPPSEVAECGLPLLAEGGSLVVSVSDSTATTWLAADLAPLAASVVERWETSSGAYLRVQRTGSAVADRFPRREAARRRAPLF